MLKQAWKPGRHPTSPLFSQWHQTHNLMTVGRLLSPGDCQSNYIKPHHHSPDRAHGWGLFKKKWIKHYCCLSFYRKNTTLNFKCFSTFVKSRLDKSFSVFLKLPLHCQHLLKITCTVCSSPPNAYRLIPEVHLFHLTWDSFINIWNECILSPSPPDCQQQPHPNLFWKLTWAQHLKNQ